MRVRKINIILFSLTFLLSGCSSKQDDFAEAEFGKYTNQTETKVGIEEVVVRNENDNIDPTEGFSLKNYDGEWKEKKEINEPYMSIRIQEIYGNKAKVQIDYMSHGYKYIASVDDNILFENNEGRLVYSEDGFGNKGEIEIKLNEDNIDVTANVSFEGTQGWGIQEGSYTLYKNEDKSKVTTTFSNGESAKDNSIFKYEGGKFFIKNITLGQPILEVESLLGLPKEKHFEVAEYEWYYVYEDISLGFRDDKLVSIYYQLNLHSFEENFMNQFSGDKYITTYDSGDKTIFFHSIDMNELLYFKSRSEGPSVPAVRISRPDWQFEQGISEGYIVEME
ncbi:hypothetical protein [Paenisporosarcina sp. TG20]|uniref:hypothetical protein n=1 Tax=Paenisporosarcina sp. TG20 TaxID=1211706 RepID=UPI0002E1ADCF|nr:hypothetical protein [Paenisporosarcina sp. TG20]